jgi:hypothetical protein
VAFEAQLAFAARNAALHGHTIADLETFDALAQLDDLARTLVTTARLVGHQEREDSTVLPEVDIGPAYAHGTHGQDDFARSGSRFRSLGQVNFLLLLLGASVAGLEQNDRMHCRSIRSAALVSVRLEWSTEVADIVLRIDLVSRPQDLKIGALEDDVRVIKGRRVHLRLLGRLSSQRQEDSLASGFRQFLAQASLPPS